MAVIRFFSTYGVKFNLVMTELAETLLLSFFSVFVLTLVEVSAAAAAVVAVVYYDMHNRLYRKDVVAKSVVVLTVVAVVVVVKVETNCNRVNRGAYVDNKVDDTAHALTAAAVVAGVITAGFVMLTATTRRSITR